MDLNRIVLFATDGVDQLGYFLSVHEYSRPVVCTCSVEVQVTKLVHQFLDDFIVDFGTCVLNNVVLSGTQ